MATATRAPVALRLAAAAQAAEAAGLVIAGVFSAVATAEGKSYELASGIALTLIVFGTAAGLAAFAVGLGRARAWARTPVVMTQAFVGGAGLFLLSGHRYGWGIPALALAAGCLAGMFTPASLRALNRPPASGAAKQTPASGKAKETPAGREAKKTPAGRQAKGTPAGREPAKKAVR
jgi:hypothetical protein